MVLEFLTGLSTPDGQEIWRSLAICAEVSPEWRPLIGVHPRTDVERLVI